jgi:hypothetical protein
VVAVDEGAEADGLPGLAQAEDALGADEELYEAEEGEREGEDDDGADDEPEAARAVDEGERGGEVDEERPELDEHEARRVGVEGEGAHGRRGERGRRVARRGRGRERQQLDEAEGEEAEERELEEVLAEAQAARAPGVGRPERDDYAGRRLEDGERPVVHRAEGQRREDEREAEREDDVAAEGRALGVARALRPRRRQRPLTVLSAPARRPRLRRRRVGD